MWMDKCLYSVRANIQVGNTWVYNNDKTKKNKSCKVSARDLKKLCILPEYSAGDLKSGKKAVEVTYLFLRIHPKS